MPYVGRRSRGMDAHFVPMLLDAAFGSRGKRLGDLAPTTPSIAQRFEPLLFRWRPGRIRPPFFHGRTG